MRGVKDAFMIDSSVPDEGWADVNAFKNIPENNPLDADLYDNGYPTERYGTRANEFNPEVFKEFVQNKLKDGATLLGGCCEIKPRHIKALTK